MSEYSIRRETPEDYRAVEELTREAFWNVYKPGADEHYFIHQMRNHPDFIPELAFVAELDGRIFKAVGFENHGGQTKNVGSPFAKVLKGHGNTYKGMYEGYADAQVIGTYMHGPLLPKNPMIADIVIARALKRHYGEVTLEPLDDTLENRAREVMLKRLGVQ